MSPRRVKGPCLDCQVDTLAMPGSRRGWYLSEYYMVHDQVWAQAGMAALGGYLCVGCLSARLGRHLDRRDLTDARVNRPNGGDTPRMYSLKHAAAIARFIRGEPGW